MAQWLDTETKALLQPALPPKDVATATIGYTLVLLDRGADESLLRRALYRIHPNNESITGRVFESPGPWSLRSELSEAEAMFGQFELICAEAVAVFLRDDVARSGDAAYLGELFGNLTESPEFAWAWLVFRLPGFDEQGRAFWDQFLGEEPASWAQAEARMPLRLRTRRKKARIMHHWIRKIGGTCLITNDTA
ncbi:MAG: hypothetical protein JW809_04620 [Pirellulales bacterium]|nr:hypothetical protein [Pirellulales bacterium]